MKKYFSLFKPFLTFLSLTLTVSLLPAQEFSTPPASTATANGVDIGTENNKNDFLLEAGASQATNTDGFPVDLQGKNIPEQATVNLYVNKPSNAAGSATLTLMVFDADNLDEGKLEINGAGPIQLFGPQASTRNNRQVVPITLATSEDWWNDGRNTLRFIHGHMDGFRIDSASLEFETMPSRFPIGLQGKNLPEQANANLYVNKPLNTTGSATLTLMVFDADALDEGKLEINGIGPIQLFGPQVSSQNDSEVVSITLTTPVNWWNDGKNTLRFVHWRTDGFRIDGASVEFEAIPSSFPIILRGNVFPEEKTIYMNVAKPSGSSGNAILNFIAFDADTPNEGQLEINGNGPIQLFGNRARSKNDRKTVPLTLTTLADWWQDGINTVRFIHTRRDGYRIESASVKFEISSSLAKNINRPRAITHTTNPTSITTLPSVNSPESGRVTMSDGWTVGDEEGSTTPNITHNFETRRGEAGVVAKDDSRVRVNSGVNSEVTDDKNSRMAATVQVGKWRRHVITLNSSTHRGNPFELEADGTFTHTNSGTEIIVPGYYSGGDVWSIAFMPTLIGKWTYETSSVNSDLDGLQGAIDCIDSGHPGMLKGDSTYAQKWKYTDGPYVVPVGLLFSAFLEPGDTAEFTGVADFLKNDVNGHLFNFRLTNLVFAGDWRDHEFDLVLWDRLDERMEILTERGLGVQIMPYTDDAGKPRWGGQTDTERLLIRYMIARLAAYPVVIFNTGIDIREFRDQTWVDWYGTQVQSLDPYDHPVSSRHGGRSANRVMANQSFDSRGARTAKINQLTEFFEMSTVPISNDNSWGENRTSQAIFGPSDLRRALWKAVMSGGVAINICDEILSDHNGADDPDFWFNANNIATALESEQWIRLVNPFIQKKLSDTFGAMVPENFLVANGLALADPSRTKILCFLMGVNDEHDNGNGGVVTVRLPGPGTEYNASWFDPRTGQETLIENFKGGNYHVISPPSSDDWVLLFEIPRSSAKNSTIFSDTNENSKFGDAPVSRTVYEDAEDGSIDSWYKYNSGTVKNIKGGANGSMRAIKISGDIENDVFLFRLGNEDGYDLNNGKEHVAEFSVAFDEVGSGMIYFRITSSDGIKYLIYSAGVIPENVDHDKVYFDLGNLAEGQWHTIQRNLEKDLMMAYPDAELIAVNGLFVYGSLRLDNISLLRYE